MTEKLARGRENRDGARSTKSMTSLIRGEQSLRKEPAVDIFVAL